MSDISLPEQSERYLRETGEFVEVKAGYAKVNTPYGPVELWGRVVVGGELQTLVPMVAALDTEPGRLALAHLITGDLENDFIVLLNGEGQRVRPNADDVPAGEGCSGRDFLPFVAPSTRRQFHLKLYLFCHEHHLMGFSGTTQDIARLRLESVLSPLIGRMAMGGGGVRTLDDQRVSLARRDPPFTLDAVATVVGLYLGTAVVCHKGGTALGSSLPTFVYETKAGRLFFKAGELARLAFSNPWWNDALNQGTCSAVDMVSNPRALVAAPYYRWIFWEDLYEHGECFQSSSAARLAEGDVASVAGLAGEHDQDKKSQTDKQNDQDKQSQTNTRRDQDKKPQTSTRRDQDRYAADADSLLSEAIRLARKQRHDDLLAAYLASEKDTSWGDAGGKLAAGAPQGNHGNQERQGSQSGPTSHGNQGSGVTSEENRFAALTHSELIMVWHCPHCKEFHTVRRFATELVGFDLPRAEEYLRDSFSGIEMGVSCHCKRLLPLDNLQYAVLCCCLPWLDVDLQLQIGRMSDERLLEGWGLVQGGPLPALASGKPAARRPGLGEYVVLTGAPEAKVLWQYLGRYDSPRAMAMRLSTPELLEACSANGSTRGLEVGGVTVILPETELARLGDGVRASASGGNMLPHASTKGEGRSLWCEDPEDGRLYYVMSISPEARSAENVRWEATPAENRLVKVDWEAFVALVRSRVAEVFGAIPNCRISGDAEHGLPMIVSDGCSWACLDLESELERGIEHNWYPEDIVFLLGRRMWTLWCEMKEALNQVVPLLGGGTCVIEPEDGLLRVTFPSGELENYDLHDILGAAEGPVQRVRYLFARDQHSLYRCRCGKAACVSVRVLSWANWNALSQEQQAELLVRDQGKVMGWWRKTLQLEVSSDGVAYRDAAGHEVEQPDVAASATDAAASATNVVAAGASATDQATTGATTGVTDQATSAAAHPTDPDAASATAQASTVNDASTAKKSPPPDGSAAAAIAVAKKAAEDVLVAKGGQAVREWKRSKQVYVKQCEDHRTVLSPADLLGLGGMAVEQIEAQYRRDLERTGGSFSLYVERMGEADSGDGDVSVAIVGPDAASLLADAMLVVGVCSAAGRSVPKTFTMYAPVANVLVMHGGIVSAQSLSSFLQRLRKRLGEEFALGEELGLGRSVTCDRARGRFTVASCELV